MTPLGWLRVGIAGAVVATVVTFYALWQGAAGERDGLRKDVATLESANEAANDTVLRLEAQRESDAKIIGKLQRDLSVVTARDRDARRRLAALEGTDADARVWMGTLVPAGVVGVLSEAGGDSAAPGGGEAAPGAPGTLPSTGVTRTAVQP